MDYNHSGTIDAYEMRTALKKAGEDSACRQGLSTQMCPFRIIVLGMVTANGHHWAIFCLGSVWPQSFTEFPSCPGRREGCWTLESIERQDVSKNSVCYWEGDSSYRWWGPHGARQGPRHMGSPSPFLLSLAVADVAMAQTGLRLVLDHGRD